MADEIRSVMVAIAQDPSWAVASRVLAALVFGSGAVLKLRHRQEFVGVVANYRLMPEVFSPAIAWSVILVESFTCLSLLTLWGRIIGPVTALLLLAIFTIAIGINLARGRDEIDCGCFQSSLRQRLGPALIVRNFALMLALLPALAAFAAPLETQASTSWSALQALDGFAAGLVAFVLYQVMSHIQALRSPAGQAHQESI